MQAQDISVLIVDDELSVRDSLYRWFKSYGCRVDTAQDAYEALNKYKGQNWDIVLLDIKMPGMDGVELQRRLKEIDEKTIRIMITAYASMDTAVQALKEGAYDYISKPINPAQLDHIIRNAIEKRRLISETASLRQKIEDLSLPEEIIGESQGMRKILEMVAEVAKTDATVMIRGESGTDKELIARAIHANSKRRYFPIITINCGAYPEGLLESEIFGHEKGSFTGAQFTRRGKLELADKGTLFFDEIGNISMKMQMDLLRVIETKQFSRLGGERMITTDFRVVSATNQDLEQDVKGGNFREDLYYRLNVFTLVLPPLRERVSDIPLLVDYFLDKFSKTMNKPVEGFTPEALDLLVHYPWPGNVRELRNIIERAMVVVKGKKIEVSDLSLPFDREGYAQGVDSLEEAERLHIQRILNRTDWNISQAASLLGIERVTLYSKIKKYGLQK
jgi:DNA-binding NtrC family response regulator